MNPLYNTITWNLFSFTVIIIFIITMNGLIESKSDEAKKTEMVKNIQQAENLTKNKLTEIYNANQIKIND